MESLLRKNPKSKIIQKGYINIYSELNDKEKRQLYYKTRYKKENPSWEESMVFLSNKFKNLKLKDPIVLDAGCGNGNYIVDENRKDIAWAVGVDASKNATLKNICLDEIKITNLENLPFESNHFDAVISLWVLEHLENPQKVINEISRVLKPGGYFLFATPNKNFLPIKIMFLLNNKKLGNILNRRLFGRKEEDVFPTYYLANTIKKLRKMTNGLFDTEDLFFNSDPSYTSFNEISYAMTSMLMKLPRIFSIITYPHIIGVIKNKKPPRTLKF